MVTPEQKVAFLHRCKADPEFFFERCCRIRVLVQPQMVKGPDDPLASRVGQWVLVPFRMRPEQRLVLRFMEDQRAAGDPVRVIICKARQLGFSTLLELYGHWLCMFHEHIRAQVVGHLQKSTNRIAEIVRIANENMPKVLKRRGAKRHGNSFTYASGSVFDAVTQGSTEASRGDTPSFLHVTELGRWDLLRSTTSAEDVMQATLSSIDDVVGTWVVVESTSGGATGSFWERWNAAIADEHQGGLWKPFFFAWRGTDKYTLVAGDEEAEQHERMRALWDAGDAIGAKKIAVALDYDQIWFERANEYGLTCGEVRWAMRTLKSKYVGRLDRFDQEFPLSWQMSFWSSGRNVFDQRVIEQWRRIRAPEDARYGGKLYEEGREVLLDPMGDEWRVYVEPHPEHEYVVGVDSASGSPEGDNACIRIFDRVARQFVATFYGKMPPDELGRQAVLAARWYNGAFLVPEGNNHGWTTIRTILDTGYRYIYTRNAHRPVRGHQDWVSKFGFVTTLKTRPFAVDMLARAVREESVTDWDQRFMAEATTFVYDEKDRPEAMSGKHDDAVMASALCMAADHEMSSPRSKLTKPEKKSNTERRFRRPSGDGRRRVDPDLGVVW